MTAIKHVSVLSHVPRSEVVEAWEMAITNSMGEFQERVPGSTPPPQSTLDATSNVPPPAPRDNPPLPPPRFDPSRMVGIIRRKSLIKDLAAVYHAECLAYCQELLELQRKREEPYADIKTPENSRKETTRPAKRQKKSR